MERPRVLDEQAVENAESARRVGMVGRAATIAGQALGLPESPLSTEEKLFQEGTGVFSEITAQYPEWKFIVESEREKLQKQALRQLLLNTLTRLALLSSPVTRYNRRRQNLYGVLI